jgi:hypothetical protein
MRWVISLVGIGTVLCVGGHGIAAAQQATPLVVPAGITVQLATMRPVWAQRAKAGDPLYAVTVAPVLAGSQTVIPAGSYVAGSLQGIVKPTNKTAHASLAVEFDKLIFADGYTVNLTGAAGGSTLATLTVKVTTANDLLLDNGTPFVMTLQSPLALDAQKVAQAVPLSHAPEPSQFVPATLCRFIPGDPGSPGTPDTVIPGTPSTVIPGVDGAPPTVIPGTPPTRIAGTAATPATDPVYCPAPPQVLSSVPGFVAPGTGAKSSSSH